MRDLWPTPSVRRKRMGSGMEAWGICHSIARMRGVEGLTVTRHQHGKKPLMRPYAWMHTMVLRTRLLPWPANPWWS